MERQENRKDSDRMRIAATRSPVPFFGKEHGERPFFREI